MNEISGTHSHGGVLQNLQAELAELRTQNKELLRCREELEDKLWRSAVLFDCAPTAFLVHDDQGTIFISNAAARTLLGPLTDAVTLFTLVDQEDVSQLKEHLGRLLLCTGLEEVELGVNTGTAKLIVRLDTVSLPGRDGKKLFQSAVSDLTRLKETERTLKESEAAEALLHSEKRMRGLVTASAQAVYRISADWSEMYDLQSGGFLVDTKPVNSCWLEQYVHPEDRERIIATLREATAAKGMFQLEHRVLLRDGTIAWAFSRVVPLLDEKNGDIVEWFGASNDITAAKNAERALRKSEERFCALVTASSQALYRMSADWREMRQLSSAGFLANTDTPSLTWLTDYIASDDQPQVIAAVEKAIRTKSLFDLEHRVRQADGSLGWTWSRAVPLLNGDGEIVEWIGAASDITERKRAEEALRQSEERFRKIFEEGPLGAVIVDLDFRFAEVNRHFCDMVGYQPEELYALTVVDLTAPEDLVATVSHPDLLLNGSVDHVSLEKRYRHRNGSVIWTTLTAWLMRDASGAASYFIGIIEDITEKKKLQKQLILSAKRDERARSSRKILNYQQRLSQLASKLSLAQEEERRRIAVEVHDGIGQNLAYCKLKVGQLQRSTPAVGGALGEVMEIIERCIITSRSLSFELSPAVLFDIGLEPALQWLARLQTRRHGLSISVSGSSSSSRELPLPLRILLFQAAREFLANAVKHAHAAHVEIILSETKKQVIIAVRDDGTGFILPASGLLPDSTSGFGLFNVQEQLHNAGGEVRIKTSPGAGTIAEASLQLNKGGDDEHNRGDCR